MGMGVGRRAVHLGISNAIAAVTTADWCSGRYDTFKDISLPPHTYKAAGKEPLHIQGMGGANFPRRNRALLAFFAGSKSSPLRHKLWERFQNDSDVLLHAGHLPRSKYHHYLATSKFCLAPRGNQVWSPRLFDAIFFGCVPVILADGYDLPFQGLGGVDWRNMSVYIPEKFLNSTLDLLRAIPLERLGEMQDFIQKVYHRFAWNQPARPGDAFHSVMVLLWRRSLCIRKLGPLTDPAHNRISGRIKEDCSIGVKWGAGG